ncbi:MAG: hypothetical protein C0592_05030 [Marinilabiliales bacterium]|nr:MAG: hypothetical protein C0592_05030 [Marinilabiliales bacterium]
MTFHFIPFRIFTPQSQAMKIFISFLFIFVTILSFAQTDVYKPIIPKGYVVYKTSERMSIDGKADEKTWAEVDFTDPFIDIEGNKKPAPFFETKVKMLWDEENFYFYAWLEEEHVWGDITERDAIIYLNNDFEIFLKPGLQWAHYAEFEVNALGTPWDLLLLSTYREGGPINFNWNIKGLQVAVHSKGTINDYSDTDKYWSVEIAMPWNVLLELYPGQKFIDKVPKPWRINFSRVQWEHEIVNGKYQRKKNAEGNYLPEYNWVWSQQSAIDMHRPEHWGYVVFSDEKPGSAVYKDNPHEIIIQYLYELYRQQKHKQRFEGGYVETLKELNCKTLNFNNQELHPVMKFDEFGFDIYINIPDTNLKYSINERGILNKTERDNFVIAAWGNSGKYKTDEEWLTALQRYTNAGITDFFLAGSPAQLSHLIQISHDFDIRIHAWVWTLNRPGDTLAQQHPEWYAVNRNGQNSLEYNAYVSYYQWLSPFSEDARQHIKDVIEPYTKIDGLASLHLDYVRFCDVILGAPLQKKYGIVQNEELPEYDYGYHPEARKQFKEIFGIDPIDMEHPELSMEWLQFRLDAVTTLVNELSDIAHGNGCKISAAVFPYPQMARKTVRQDWARWNLDMVLPMIYHNFYDQNLNWIEFATQQGVTELDGRFPLYTGLYIPALGPEELKEAIIKAKAAGASGVALFDLNALTDEHLKVLK